MKPPKTLMLEASKEPRSPVEDLLITAVMQLTHDLDIMSCRVQSLELHVRDLRAARSEGEK